MGQVRQGAAWVEPRQADAHHGVYHRLKSLLLVSGPAGLPDPGHPTIWRHGPGPGGRLVRLVISADNALVRSDHAHREKRRRLVGKDASGGMRASRRRRTSCTSRPARPGSTQLQHARFPGDAVCFLAGYPVNPCSLPSQTKCLSSSSFLFLSLSLFLYVNFKTWRVFIDLQYCVGFECAENNGSWWLSGKKTNPLQCRRDLGLIPGSERSPGEGTDKPAQYSCPETSMDRGYSP